MAELKQIELKSYVRWPVKGGTAFGQVVTIKDDKTVLVETPTNSINEVALAELVLSTEEEYHEAVDALVTLVEKKTKSSRNKRKEKDMITQANDTAASDTVKAELDKAKAEYETAMKSKDESCAKQVAEAKSEAEAARAEAAKYKGMYEEASAKIVAAEKAATAQARFNEIKGFDALDTVGTNETEALAALAEMDATTYAVVSKIAKASSEKIVKAGQTNQAKLTDQSQTNMPKLTEQSQTDKEKLTQASAAAAEVLDAAKKDEENTLATAATADTSDSLNAALSNFASYALNRNKKKTKTNEVEK